MSEFVITSIRFPHSTWFSATFQHLWMRVLTTQVNEHRVKVKVAGGNYQSIRLQLCRRLEWNCGKLVAQILEPFLNILLSNQIYTHKYSTATVIGNK